MHSYAKIANELVILPSYTEVKDCIFWDITPLKSMPNLIKDTDNTIKQAGAELVQAQVWGLSWSCNLSLLAWVVVGG